MKIRDIINNPPNDYYTKLAMVESSGNPLAETKTSSAAGLYQFTKGTWEDMTKRLGLNYTLDDRFDPDKSRRVVEEFTKQNETYLTNKLGRKPNQAELYLAHFSGMGGANKLLTALQSNPNTSVENIFSKNQIKANKSIFLNKDGSYKKAKDIYNWAATKFEVQEYSEPKQENTSISQIVEQPQEQKIDNTSTFNPRIASVMNNARNASYAYIGEEEAKPKKDLTKEDIVKILQQERSRMEQEFLTQYSRQNQPQQQVEEAPSQQYYPQQGVYDMYQIEDYTKYADGGGFDYPPVEDEYGPVLPYNTKYPLKFTKTKSRFHTTGSDQYLQDLRPQYTTTDYLSPTGERVQFEKAVVDENAQKFLSRYNDPVTRKRLLEQTNLTEYDIDNAILQGLTARKEVGNEVRGSKGSYYYPEHLINLSERYAQDPSVETHERVHASMLDQALSAPLQEVLGNTFQQKTRSFLKRVDPETLRYLNQPHEAYGNFAEFREQIKLKPGEQIDVKELKKRVKKYGLSSENFYRAFDDDRIVKALNTIAQVDNNNTDNTRIG